MMLPIHAERVTDDGMQVALLRFLAICVEAEARDSFGARSSRLSADAIHVRPPPTQWATKGGHDLISQTVLITLFCKTQFPHKSVILILYE